MTNQMNMRMNTTEARKRLMLMMAAGLVSGLAFTANAQTPKQDQTRTELDDLMSGPQIDPFMIDELDQDRPARFGQRGRQAKRGQEGQRRQRGPEGRDGQRGPRGPGDRLSAQLLEEFDTNADGKLDETERSALKAHMEAKRAAFIKQYDTDADGSLNEEERAAMKASIREKLEALKAEMIERFDTDGDGKLTGDERLDARDAARERMEEITGGFGPAGKRGGKAHGKRGGPEGRQGQGRQGRNGRAGQDGDREAMKQKLLEEFDADGDGKLTGDERELAKAAMQERRGAATKGRRGDRGQRGQRGSRGVRSADTNRDGVIDETELAAAAALVSKGDPKADYNRDGKVDADDLAFLTKRAAGG